MTTDDYLKLEDTKKITLDSIDQEKFLISSRVIGGRQCYFVRPQHDFFDWTDDVLHLRSSIWSMNKDTQTLNLISASFPKFFNLEEKPTINPLVGEISTMKIMEKLDGSTLIVSRYNKETILRTRGTVDASGMHNASELDIFREKYADFFRWAESFPTLDFSFLFEWTSPLNRIILDYGQEPELYLTAIVDHFHYKFLSQEVVDTYASTFGFKRPKVFQFKSFDDLVKEIGKLEDYEGVCVYYNNDQNIRKVKSLKYLKLHAFKSELSLKNLTEIFYHYNNPSQEEFLQLIEREYDWECAHAASPFISDLYTKFEWLKEELSQLQAFVEANKELIQKDFALKLIEKNDTKGFLNGFGFLMRSNNFSLSKTKKAFLEFYV